MKYTEERITYAMKLHRMGLSTKDICGKLGICRQTFYHWQKYYSGIGLTKLRELSSLKNENTALKKIVADLSLATSMLQQEQKAIDPPAGALSLRSIPED